MELLQEIVRSQKVAEALGQALTRALSRRALYNFNKALYLVSLRGMGLNNGAYGDGISYPEQRFLKRFAAQSGPNPLIIDVGANAGQFALSAVRFVPRARVIAFEPNPHAFARLESNVRVAGAAIELEQLALANQCGTLDLYDLDGQEGTPFASLNSQVVDCAARALRTERAEPMHVPVERLEDWLDRRGIDHIDLLKIDAEGSELEVLKGVASRLARGAIRHIQFEFNYCNVYTKAWFRDFVELLPNYGIARLLYSGELLPLQYSPKYCELFSYQVLIASLSRLE